VAGCYEGRPIIITSNKSFTAWAAIATLGHPLALRIECAVQGDG
jgi:hypothetical protein